MTPRRSERIGPAEHLAKSHDLSRFHCGVPELDAWLRERAGANEDSGASRTYVICIGRRVVGYYALAVGGVARLGVTGRVKRNMPEPIPVMLLARLAVDSSYQGRGLGQYLVRDALLRTFNASGIGGIRAILVHATSEEARSFYEGLGFSSSPIDPMTLTLPVEQIHHVIGQH